MKTKFWTYLLISTLLIAFVACKNDKKQSEKKTKNPEFETQDYFFPPQVFYFQERENYLVDKFYPIGWSKDGFFAYITEPQAPALGNYIFELTIINVLNGDTLWYWHSPYDKETVREEVWKNNYDLFKTMLNKYKIVQLKQPKLLPPYFNYNGNDYSVELQTDFQKRSGYGYEPITHTRIIIRSKQKGVKVAYDYWLPKNSILINQTIAGVMLSPFGDKIAIVLQQERPGYEGPPNVVTFQIVGTDLTTGWNSKLE